MIDIKLTFIERNYGRCVGASKRRYSTSSKNNIPGRFSGGRRNDRKLQNKLNLRYFYLVC